MCAYAFIWRGACSFDQILKEISDLKGICLLEVRVVLGKFGWGVPYLRAEFCLWDWVGMKDDGSLGAY
jgi:hypothetical protein